MLSGGSSRGVLFSFLCSFGLTLTGGAFKVRPLEDPWTVRKGMDCFDPAGFGCQPERFGCDVEQGCRLGQVEPWLDTVGSWTVCGDLSVRPQGADPLSGPAIAIAGAKPIPVQDAGNQIVLGDEGQLLDGFDDVCRCAVAPSTAVSSTR